ncbi:MAG: ABC transporter permease [candidate division WOR-3 bacterium]
MRLTPALFGWVVLLGRSLALPWDLRRMWPRFLDQLFHHGVAAVPIVALASVFVGLTTAVQTSYQLLGVVPKYFVGMGVGRMLLIELAPVFTGFVVAGRSASAISAELAAMRSSEQIDALKVMAIDHYRFLCLPRILAVVVALPMLVVLMEALASAVALLAASALGTSAETFLYGFTHFVAMRDFWGGIAKALLFGLAIGTTGCHCGLGAPSGAEQVGRAATRAVVTSAALILLANFVTAVAVFGR